MKKSLFYVDSFEYDTDYNFFFELDSDQSFMSVSVGQMGDKFYAPGCNPYGHNQAIVIVYKESNWGWSQVDYMWTYNTGGSISVELTDVSAGNYKAEVKFYQGSAQVDAKEFSLGVYTYEEVEITSDDGFTNQDPDFHVIEDLTSNLGWI